MQEPTVEVRLKVDEFELLQLVQRLIELQGSLTHGAASGLYMASVSRKKVSISDKTALGALRKLFARIDGRAS